jgi:pimeloyl-ACP methyl ester carboxylesterase
MAKLNRRIFLAAPLSMVAAGGLVACGRQNNGSQGSAAISGDDFKRIELRDGRVLAYSEYGSPDGQPIIYFHGAPSSRLEERPDPADLASLGLRIIASDRPGIGRSDPKPGRRLIELADDIVELTAQLGIHDFAVMGASAGGPYALACAAQLPTRVRAVGLNGSVAPIDAPEMTEAMGGQELMSWRLAHYAPWALEIMFRAMSKATERPGDSWIDSAAKSFPEPDRSLFKRPEYRASFAAAFKEAFRQGPQGPVQDIGLVARPWRFDLTSIKTPVVLWQGGHDGNIPFAAGHYLKSKLANCRATFKANEGHLSLGLNFHREILADLMLAASTSSTTGSRA